MLTGPGTASWGPACPEGGPGERLSVCHYGSVAWPGGVGTHRAPRAGRQATHDHPQRGAELQGAPRGAVVGTDGWEGACSQWLSGPHLPAASKVRAGGQTRPHSLMRGWKQGSLELGGLRGEGQP